MNSLIAIVSMLLLASNIALAKLSFAEAVAQQRERAVHYSNSWAVEILGGEEEADALAARHGLVNRGQIGNQNNYYLFMEGDTAKEVPKDVSTFKTTRLREEEQVESVKQEVIKMKVKKDYSSPTDPGWRRQWSLENSGQYGQSGLDINVEPAWMQGVTGDGIVVALVDDGMDWRHSDLRGNYDSQASRDFIHYDSDPTPDWNSEEPNSHGTECAGVVGMARNGICGVGVAHDANIGSLKFDVGGSTDAGEASAVGYKDYYIDVYSNSWGPTDFGFVVDGPGSLVQNTLATGATEGRGGKGNIYVWAAGNGGQYFDSCAADGYSSSIYTISAGSADQNGRQAEYDEDCSAKMVVTFSYNSDSFPGADDSFDPYNQVYTTTLDNQCTDGFTGTSASTPIVAGVIALTLQVNPQLTWRDVQYLLAYTSNPDILRGGDWVTNGAGLKVSHHFGFGAIDSEAMVTRARHWTNVPEQHSKTVYSSSSYATIYSSATRTFAVSESTSQNSISSLEHVVIKTSLSIDGVPYYSRFDYDDLYDALYYTDDIYDWLESPHARRGDIKIELTSPQGTKSVLLPYRNYDFVNEEGYDNWPFMSVHFWGENPAGTWTLKIVYTSGSGYVSMSGLSMTLYGTASVPSSVSSIPTNCHSSCVRGCSGSGPSYCDSCVHYRLASNLTCVDQCPSNTHTIKKYCYGNSDAVSRTTTVSSSTSGGDQSSSSETSTTSSSKAQTTTSSSTSRGTETTETSTGQTSTSSSKTDVEPTTTSSASRLDTSSSVELQIEGRNSQYDKTLPIAVGVSAGVVVVLSAIVILAGVSYVVYMKKCKGRMSGFIPLTKMDREIET